MPDNIDVAPSKAAVTAKVATDLVDNVHYPVYKLAVSLDGSTPVHVSSTNPLPVSGPLTDTELRATAVPVSGPLTDTELRDSDVGVAVNSTVGLTDTELRATHLHVVPEDDFGFQSQMTPMRDMKVTEPYRVVGSSFGASIDAKFWTAINSGTASASGVASGISTISSGTSNDGYGQLSSFRPARFQFAHPLQFRAAIRIPNTTIALNTRRWGSFSVSTVTPQNGCYFEIDAAGTLSVVCVSGGTPTAVSSGSFNGSGGTTYTLDTDMHRYEIIYFTAGVWFYIDDILIHSTIPTTALIAEDLTVPINVTSVNDATGVTSGTIEFWNGVIIKLGRDITAPLCFYQDGTVAAEVLKIGAGTVQKLNIADVSNTAVLTLYDNTAASGTILYSTGAMGAQSKPFIVDLTGVAFFTGLTLAITGANCKVTVVYE